MAKTIKNQKKAAKEFAERWRDKGYEKGESPMFWIDLLEHVYGIENIADFIEFEDQVHLDHTSFIDAYIPATHVMIEQKGFGKDLEKPIKQSDGSFLTPFKQAKRYVTELPLSRHPRWIITCNFSEFLIYDMENPQGEPERILLKDLDKDFYRLQFLVDTKDANIRREEEISLKAGELVGKLYDAILKQYNDPENDNTLKSLNILCVRLVFLLYAEDAGIFPEKDMFGRYLAKFQADETREKLLNLFAVLNTRPENRDPYLNDDLAAFPYVNGGLFAEKEIEIPRFNAEIVEILVNKASAGFDWSEISPTIFGAVFESTLNRETRRKGGMHYTSIENIHKVIDPLFMDDLKAEFAGICRQTGRKRMENLENFRNKIAQLKFLDPACGSGNFLTETYISLRRLENEVLKKIHGSQMLIGKEFSPIKVKISQFYGIEINDFAVTVAKTALWIAESQMMRETEEIVDQDLEFLPLSTNATIVEGNALRMDWSTLSEEKNDEFFYTEKLNLYKSEEKHFEVSEPKTEYGRHFKELNVVTEKVEEKELPKERPETVTYDYIIGNPPFVGFTFMSSEQKEDVNLVFPGIKNIDYVCCWYKKASNLIQDAKTRCAFVSTNSITQGETVARFAPNLKVKYDFAYRTFVWNSESENMAHVHCVIIGFSFRGDRKDKFIADEKGIKTSVENINAYLVNAPDVIVDSRNKPLSAVSKMVYGNKPADGGFLIIEEDAYDDFIRKDPSAEKFIRPFIGAVEYLHNKKRWCLWLTKAAPDEIKKSPLVYERVKKCQMSRESSIATGIQKFADTPHLFAQRTQPEGENYIVVPRVSSENRRFIPMGFMTPETIVSDAVQIVPNATLYEFGILTSSVHMAWMRTVCGRLKSDYRYSKDIVYNNFPWCDPTEKQKKKIEQTAQTILETRTKFPQCSLADLYDEVTMPIELRKAHSENDRAVMQAYGFDPKMSENDIVAELFKIYRKLTEKGN